MRSLVFEGKTWLIYEQLREKYRKLHNGLCKILKEMLRTDPSSGLGKPEPLKHNLRPQHNYCARQCGVLKRLKMLIYSM